MADVLKRRILFNYYKARADIICFQETHSDETVEEIWRSEFGGDIYYSHGNTSTKGVCICIKKNICFNVVRTNSDDEMEG